MTPMRQGALVTLGGDDGAVEGGQGPGHGFARPQRLPTQQGR